jgi:hypothetical protein
MEVTTSWEARLGIGKDGVEYYYFYYNAFYERGTHIYCSTMARIWKQPRCSSINEWTRKIWHIKE